jgi:ribosomal protein S18 acetylase RimI-like enzyme
VAQVTVEIANMSTEHDAGLRDLLLAEGWASHAKRLLNGPSSLNPELYVALISGTVAGFAEGTFNSAGEFDSGDYPPPQARIESLLVSSQARRLGVGTALVRRFVTDAQAADLSSVLLFPSLFDPAGRLAFFESCGFTKIDGSELYGAPLQTVLSRTRKT